MRLFDARCQDSYCLFKLGPQRVLENILDKVVEALKLHGSLHLVALIVICRDGHQILGNRVVFVGLKRGLYTGRTDWVEASTEN